MREYEVVDTNADNIGGCGICRYKSGKNEGRRRKLDWLKKRYAEGLRFKVLRQSITVPSSEAVASTRWRCPPCFWLFFRRAFSIRRRRIASAAAVKKRVRLFQFWLSSPTSRR